MTKEMRRNTLCELGGVARLTADMGDTCAGDRFGDAVSRKEPGLELREFPGAPEQWEQIGGEHHQAIALPFALTYLDDHTLRVDVGALQRIFPAHGGERRTISEGYLYSCPFM